MSEFVIPAEWETRGTAILRKIDFKDFRSLTNFVVKLMAAIERLGHHPRVTFNQSSVEIESTSHDVGRITARDVELALMVEDLLNN